MTSHIDIQKLRDGDVFECPSNLLSLSTYNTRLGRNQAAEELLAGFQANGFEGTLDVTCDPDNSSVLTPFRGGNTRVALIQQLAESGDKRFQSIPCKFHDWPGTAGIISRHLSENDHRSPINFISSAIAVLNLLKETFQENLSNVSTRARVDALVKNYGYRISRSKLTLYEFVTDRILSDLSVRTFLISDDVIELYDRAVFNELYSAHNSIRDVFLANNEKIFDECWFETLNNSTVDTLSDPNKFTKYIYSTISARLAELTGSSTETIRLAIEAKRVNKNKNTKVNNDTALEREVTRDGGIDKSLDGCEAKTISSSNNYPSLSHANPSTDCVGVSSDTTDVVVNDSQSDTTSTQRPYNYILREIAELTELSHCIQYVDANKQEYFQMLLPGSEFQSMTKSRVWWLLVNLSGMDRITDKSLIKDTTLRQLFSGDTDSLLETESVCGKKVSAIKVINVLVEQDPDYPNINTLLIKLLNAIAEYKLNHHQHNAGQGEK